jgi:hypothetical protein
VAIERGPPRREAGAGLALPVFNKECEAPLIFFRAKRGDFLCWFPCLRVCVGGLSARAIRSGFPHPFEASGFWCFGGITQHFRGFAFFGFLSFSLFFSLFFLALFTHKSMHFFGSRSWLFSFGSSSFAELRNKGQGRGARRAGLGCLL